MKAIVFRKYGSTEVLELTDLHIPTSKRNEALVKVHATSINLWDWELLRGKPFINNLTFGLRKPKKINIIACDISGQVEAVGKNVKYLQPGDAVFCDLSGQSQVRF